MLLARVPSVSRAGRFRAALRSAAPFFWALGGHGCATIFGMEDASCSDCTVTSVEPSRGASSADASNVAAPADGGAELRDSGSLPALPPVDPCVRYCDSITATCQPGSGELPDRRAYLDRDACLEVCPYFPTGAAAGNTLECRLGLLESPEAVERSVVCQAAGRAGQAGADAVCGSNCDAYCALMTRVCPAEFSTLAPSCASACAALGDRQAFDVLRDETGGNTVQCRLWHVAVAASCAAADADCRSRHCRHAAGASPCNPPAP